ncbi:MAG: hypothetical protein C5B50_01135, partial [Verrucomicrobia bacterium]
MKKHSLHWPTFILTIPCLWALLGASSKAAPSTNYALAFNGQTNCSASIATGAGSLAGTFTVECWVNPATASGPLGIIGSRQTNNYGFDFKIKDGNLLHGDIGNGSNFITITADAAFTFTPGQWHHIAYVVTPTNYNIYIDGNPKGGTNFPADFPILYQPGNSLFVGQTGFPNENMNGQIDEVRIWSTARSQAQILASMNSLLTGSEPGLKAYWRFDENAGTTSTDLTGNGLTASWSSCPSFVQSSAPIPYSVNYALAFSGQTNCYAAVNTGAGSLAGTFTVEAWANPATTSGALGIIGSRQTNNYGFDFKIKDGTLLHGDIGNGSNFITITADVPNFTFTPGKWHHIAYVVTPTNYTIYTDGNLAGGTNYPPDFPILYQPGNSLFIGKTGFPSENMNGWIDEVRIWSTARSQAQIQANKNQVLTGTEPGLQAYWRFDEGSGTSSTDLTGHGLTATWSACPLFTNTPVPWFQVGPPSIDAQPNNVTANVGASASFSVQASGSSPLTFQWQFNGTNLVDNTRISGSTSNTLSIANLLFSDQGSYQVRVSNAYGSTNSTPAALTVSCPTVTLNPPTLPGSAVNGSSYSRTVTGSGGAAPYTFSLLSGSQLPSGITFTNSVTNTAVLSGIPQAVPGAYPVIVRATDINGCSGTNSYTINLNCGSGSITLSPTNNVLPPAVAGSPYNLTFTASGGSGSYSFSATNLPSGLTLSSSGGLNGSVGMPGSYNFTVIATDTNTTCLVGRNYTLTVTCQPCLAVSPTCAPSTVDMATASYSIAGSVNNCSLAAVTNVLVTATATNVATGLLLSANTTLASIPAQSSLGIPALTLPVTGCGTYIAFLTVSANGLCGQVSTSSSTCSTVISNSSLLISPATLPPATVGVPYNQPLSASSGGGSYTLLITNGTLPAGITLSNGVSLTGTPTTAGTSNFVVTAAFTNGCYVNQAYSLTVGTAPFILTQPTSRTVNEGANTTFSVTASGTGPLAYQWMHNGTNVASLSVSPANLTITNAQVTDAGSYQVLVSSAYGSTNSAIATLTVRDPFVTGNPATQTVSVGTNVTFRVTAGGSPTLTYQWSFDGVDIAGATLSALSLSNVQVTNAGYYRVVVANPLGSTNVQAALSVVGPVTNSNGAVQAPPGLVDWWPAEGNARDMADSHNGSPVGNLSYAPGEVGLGFKFDGVTSYVNLGTTNLPPPWTASFWVNRQDAANNSAALICNNFSTNGYALKLEQYPFTRKVGITRYGVSDVAFNYSVPTNTWTHLVFVAGPSNISLYANGAFQDQTNGTIPLPRTAIGGNPFGIDHVLGVVDEISVFNRALDTNEINTLYAAGLAGQYVQPIVAPTVTIAPPSIAAPYGSTTNFNANVIGTPPFSYQWILNSTNLPGQTASTLVITNAQDVNAGSYQVQVQDTNGSAISAAATLRVGSPPGLTLLPTNLAVNIGTTATFNVAATGTAPLSYQWRFGGVPLPGASATLPSLVIPSAGAGNVGTYDVVVSNDFGSTNSPQVTLAVFTHITVLQEPASAQVNQGSSATFQVVAISSAPLSYQWYQDGNSIAGATGSAYTIANAQSNNAGAYFASVSSPAETTNSTTATLTVIPFQPPPPPPSYTIAIHTGKNLIANQLNQGGNTLNEIMPAVPNGTVLSKYVNSAGVWVQATFSSGSGWAPGNLSLSPGEGAFLASPTNFNLVLTGTPQTTVSPVSIPNNVAYLLSRQTNDVAHYKDITGFDPIAGAKLYRWTNSSYSVYTFDGTSWSGGTAPTVAVGESVWIAPNGGTNGTPVDVPAAPTIISQPTSVTVGLGGAASFTVGATGSQPLYYQWLLNANPIAGATASTLTINPVQFTNAGAYSVVVNNSIGITNSAIVSLSLSNVNMLPFNDTFANAGVLLPVLGGSGFGSNINATLESSSGEPGDPGFIPIGASVWLKWTPQANGIAHFDTIGSGLDTVLAIYTGSSVGALTLVAVDDDSAPFLCSSLSFNATNGITYYIQVSGYHGDTGDIELSWNELVTHQAPVIVSQPTAQTVPPGTTATLSVCVQPNSTFDYQWRLDGQPVFPSDPSLTQSNGPACSSLTISNLDQYHVGFYSVVVTDHQTGDSSLSSSAHVMILEAGPGFIGNPALVSGQTKLQDAANLTPPDPNIEHDPSFVSGYTGAFTDGNCGGAAQTGEPPHCGFAPSHTIWYAYVPIVSGSNTFTFTSQV